MKASVHHLQSACRRLTRARQAFLTTRYDVAFVEVEDALEDLRRVLNERRPTKRRAGER